MEAVPAPSGVRRTVRLATALVIGQVLLVAVIGWVTFAYADKHPGGGRPAVDQLAAPPAVLPPVPGPGRSATETPTTSTTTAGRGRTAEPDLPAAPRSSPSSRAAAGPAATGAPTPPDRTPAVPSAPPTATTPVSGPTTPPLTQVPTPDSPAVATPAPTSSAVLAGQPCTPIFALKRTADGWMVRCLPTRDHRLIWKIV